MNRKIVFYCLKNCWMSWNAAKRAKTFGYTQVLWYPGGTEGWRKPACRSRIASLIRAIEQRILPVKGEGCQAKPEGWGRPTRCLRRPSL